MASYDCTGIPRCTIEYSPDFSNEETGLISRPINTLLKSSCLLRTNLDLGATAESIFDIAEEIAGVEACGFLQTEENTARDWELSYFRGIDPDLSPERLQNLVAPAALVSHFGKAVSMDPDWGDWSRPICDAWASRSLVSFPLRRDREIAGALVFGKMTSHPFSIMQVKLLWALSLQAEQHLENNNLAGTLSLYSFIDPVTHLNNRRYFDFQMEKEVLRSRRNGKATSLLIFSMDGLKESNAIYGSTGRDIPLQEFSVILTNCVREVDTVARIGPEQFAVILVESQAEGGRSLADRIIQRFQRQPPSRIGEAGTDRITVSVGIASFPADSFDKADTVSKAYNALALARSRGGGCACVYHEIADLEASTFASQDLPVKKIYDASRSVVDMERFLEVLLFTVMQRIGAGRGSIVVREPTGDFFLRAAIGFKESEGNLLSAGTIRPGEVTAWVVDHQIPLLVSAPEDSPLASPRKKNGYKTTSFLSMPLIAGGRSLGAIHLTNRRNLQPFTREDLNLFAPVASEIARILEQGMKFRGDVRDFALLVLGSLSNALELRFPFLSGHSTRVRALSVSLGEKLGLGDADLSSLRIASGLHDIGIAGTSGELLMKKKRLSEQEMEIARMHPFLGAKMLEGVPDLDTARRVILEHHERYDGTGYPSGLRGEEISLPARILSVAEFYDSLISDRPYRRGFHPEDALKMVREGCGSLFDPEVASALLESPLLLAANPAH